MNVDEGRVLTLGIYVLWAVASVTVWGRDVIDAYRMHRVWRDERSRREFIDSLGLFMVAAASFASLVVLVIGNAASRQSELVWVRGFALALALGSFLTVGILRRTLSRRQRRTGRYGRRIGDKA